MVGLMGMECAETYQKALLRTALKDDGTFGLENVMLAQAGIQGPRTLSQPPWIPAFAGMTDMRGPQKRKKGRSQGPAPFSILT